MKVKAVLPRVIILVAVAFSAAIVKGAETPASEASAVQDSASNTAVLMPADLIRAGLASHPDRSMALARIGAAEAMLATARSAFYPSLGLYSEYVRGDAPSAYLFKSIDQRKLPPNTDFNDPGDFENHESGARLRLNLYNGGRDYLDLEIARSNLALTHLDRQGIDNALVAAIIAAYFDALTARAMIATSLRSVETVRSRLKVMRVRHAAGGALKSDLLSLEVRLAMAREAVLMGKNAFEIALAALEQLTDTAVAPAQLPAEAAVILPEPPARVEEAVTMAL